MIVRSLLLLLPMAIWAGLFYCQRLSVREISATFLGFVWAFQALFILNIFALKLAAWVFVIEGNLFYGVPVDWVLAQAIIFGSLLPLTRAWRWNIRIRLLLQLMLLIAIYASGSLKVLNGLTAGLLLLLIFIASSLAALLADWTATDTQIRGRALLQPMAWACLLFWLFPSLVFSLTSDSWSGFLQRDLLLNGILLLPLLLPAYLLGNALYQFAEVGGGTAFPFDPPRRLVTSGVYRYLSNPMQLGICLAMGWWGFILESFWIMASALIAVLLFVVFKQVCNGSCAIGAGNPEWETYQSTVPRWWPRITPHE